MFGKQTLVAASLVALACVVVGGSAAAQAAWEPAKGPLMTRWAKDVSPDKVHPEYPRPQMVREDWLRLNGLWQYAEAKEGEAPPVGKDLDGQILVPFPIQSALSGVMKEADRLWYRRTFAVPAKWKGQRVVLHFGAVDWETTVYVNGKKVGEHRGGYDAFSADITDALKAGGEQELIVGVFDPTDKGDQPRGKQVLKPGGIMYTAVTGIWQTAWLEPVPAAHIRRLVLTPDVDGKCLRLTAETAGAAEGLTVEAVATDGGKEVGKISGDAGKELRLSVPDAKLWSPDTPHLYDLKVELRKGGKPVDAVTSYFGMRKIELGKDADGVVRLLLNGKFVFQVGPLDQGWWPDGLYIAPTDEAFKYDVQITRQLGFNMARKHVKVEPDRWYYWCDRLGLMVWQDMPSGNNATPEAKKQFETELVALVEGFRNHPSIILWVVFNEGWGQHDTERYVRLVKERDPSRLVNNASGWTDKKVGDVNDIHSYPNPRSPKPEPTRAVVLGEFGGLGLGIDGHTWKKEHWGYKGMADREELTAAYERLLQAAYKLKDTEGLSAVVYTQTTDVEVECNGLLTYDRAIVKPDLERVSAVNRGDFSRVPPPPIVKTVVPTSEEQRQEWRYTFEKPADEWIKADFDDSAWKKGPGGFGTGGTPGAVIGTEWKTADVWLRREVTIPQGDWHKLAFRVHHDEDAEVYVNGVKAAEFKGYVTGYEERPINDQGRAAVKPGKVVLAVHCRQTQGGQFIDLGLVDVVPAKKK
ncbi:MAG TPA: glycoside hydrolase family 2 TIM barrel-domain containing protein [Phycisphaerae bacterium]|nr:glycoside hydrolase family 2 TIM barrel-domain containing protein [Phycisphaerae bacterium]